MDSTFLLLPGSPTRRQEQQRRQENNGISFPWSIQTGTTRPKKQTNKEPPRRQETMTRYHTATVGTNNATRKQTGGERGEKHVGVHSYDSNHYHNNNQRYNK